MEGGERKAASGQTKSKLGRKCCRFSFIFMTGGPRHIIMHEWRKGYICQGHLRYYFLYIVCCANNNALTTTTRVAASGELIPRPFSSFPTSFHFPFPPILPTDERKITEEMSRSKWGPSFAAANSNSRSRSLSLSL